MLVLDASAALALSAAQEGFVTLADEDLFAPPHMWAEVRSSLHEALWRGEIARNLALGALDRFETAPIRSRAPRRLGREAWQTAEELGWAKTYDAEYVALARLLRCRLVTQDLRLHRHTQHLGFVVGLSEL